MKAILDLSRTAKANQRERERERERRGLPIKTPHRKALSKLVVFINGS